jgi:hypothetical protein
MIKKKKKNKQQLSTKKNESLICSPEKQKSLHRLNPFLLHLQFLQRERYEEKKMFCIKQKESTVYGNCIKCSI